MKLQDLSTGMVIELRNGRRYIIFSCLIGAVGLNIENDEAFVFYDSKQPTFYNENLTHKTDFSKDIVKVSQIETNVFDHVVKNATPIWECNEPKKMTVSEICKELGYEVEIVKE